MKNMILFLCLGVLLAACKSKPSKINKAVSVETWGKMPDGRTVELYTLTNHTGMQVQISNYGGIIKRILAPNRHGSFEDVVLGYDSLKNYMLESPYFGAIVGRYGNRIAKGKFTIDSTEYTLAQNNLGNHLHGGLKGFDKALWNAEVLKADHPSLRLSYLSPDGEEGYPGNLNVSVVYSLQHDNSLLIEYYGTTDKPTVINLTNHSYFNLSSNKQDVLNHEIEIYADRYIPIDETLIPTGTLDVVKNTPFDFNEPKPIGKRIKEFSNTQIKRGGGYDHCWVLRESDIKLNLFAVVKDQLSGRKMEVYTSEPGVQFYTGNFLNGTINGKKHRPYLKHDGFCLETQHFPDSPNQPMFPSTILLPGQTYQSSTMYKFSRF